MPDMSISRRGLMRGGIVVSAAAAGATVIGTTTAALAAAPEPSLHSTAQWGARPPSEPLTTVPNRPSYIVVHHTATSNDVANTQAQAYTLARNVQSWHMSQGWGDSGQQFTISRGGYIMEGRHGSISKLRGGTTFIRGIHAGAPANGESIGIENEGLYTGVQPPGALYDSLLNLCAHLCSQYGIAASKILGHRDFMATQCPGDKLYAMLPQLRADVAEKLGQQPPPPTWPTVKKGASGERVRSIQYLLRQAGDTTAVDGAFGPGTETDVREFQTAKGLTVDGVVGPQTWARLVVVSKQGASGEAVKAIQRQLNNNHGISTTVDGAFGPGTTTSVRTFQTRRSLVVDGVVGPITWQALVG